MGTDLPFAIAEMEPVRLVDACGFAPHERAAILGDTAATLFGILLQLHAPPSSPHAHAQRQPPPPPSDKPGIGQPVRRKEDLRLVTGPGCYSDDVNLPGQAYAVMVRSPHAHARIRGDRRPTPPWRCPACSRCSPAPTVVADGLKPIPHKPWSPASGRHPAAQHATAAPAFTRAALSAAGRQGALRRRGGGDGRRGDASPRAKDAAERVAVDYEPLPAVTDAAAAAEPDAPRLYEDDALQRLHRRRASATPRRPTRPSRAPRMSSRSRPGCSASPACRWSRAPRSASTIAATRPLHAPRRQRRRGAARSTSSPRILGVPPRTVRVVARDVGGNFGTRNAIYPEFALVAWAARRVGRPVKWTCERSEAFLSDYQGRDLAVEAELALDARRQFPRACAARNLSNVGAPHRATSSAGAKGVEIMSSIYRMPAAHFRARACSPTRRRRAPIAAPAGRRSMFVMERLIDLAARAVRLRPRRAAPAQSRAEPPSCPTPIRSASPTTAATITQAMDARARARRLERAFRRARAEARRRGKLRGIGVANYIDTATGVPRERAEITVHAGRRRRRRDRHAVERPGPRDELRAAASPNGSACRSTRVRLITGDTDIVPVGGGSHSGRSHAARRAS